MKQKSPEKDISKILSKVSKEHFSLDFEENQGDVSKEQKTLLAETFLSRGEFQLLKGEVKGIYLFETASKLDPKNPKLFYRQGLALLEYGSQEGKEKILLIACKKFKKSIEIDKNYFNSWLAYGNTLLHLGTIYEEHHYFLEAEKILFKAISLVNNQPNDVLIDLFSSYARSCLSIALHSSEAVDFQKAINSFQKASNLQQTLPYDFWIDFGNACTNLGGLINDAKLHLKAIDCYKQAINSDPLKEEGWHSLAQSISKLYLISHEDDHFQQASDCFAACVRMKPEKVEAWLDWGKFFTDSAKKSLDPKKLEPAIEKFKRAFAYNANDPLILAYWSESLALLGEAQEKLEWIYQAQNYAWQALQSGDHLPESWLAEGQCFLSLGRYFQDVDFYYEAMNRFQTGLSIDRTHHELWHAIATACGLIALALADHEMITRACRFSIKAIKLQRCSNYVYDLGNLLSKFGELTHEKTYLEQASFYLEQALDMQKNVLTLHPDWLFQYAVTLDTLGDFHEEEHYYTKAIDLFLHILILHPDFPNLHHRLALTYSHLGDMQGETDPLHRALQHYRIAMRKEEENDVGLIDWGTTLINLARLSSDPSETQQICHEAEHKLTQAAKLGNMQAYYPLSCLYSLKKEYDNAMLFLKKAYATGALPPMEELLQDDWIDGLKMTIAFREFLDQIAKK